MPQLDWQAITAAVQFLIIPAVMWIWQHERKVSSIEREILRVLTILDERNKRRDEDRAEIAEAMRELKAAISKLNDRLDTLGAES